MSESSPSLEIAELKEAKVPKAQLLDQQTQALRVKMESQLGLSHLLYWGIAGFGGTTLALLITWVFLFATNQGVLMAVLTLFYMLAQGLILGIIAAALLIVARFLQQLSTIIDLTLQTLRESLVQARALGEGEITFRELSTTLIHGAVLPVAQNLITLKLGLLSLPIGFVVNRILRRVMRRMTDALQSSPRDPETTEKPPKTVEKSEAQETSPGKISRSLQRGETHLDRIQNRIDRIARRTRLATLVPAGVLFSLLAALSSAPWLVLYFTTR